MDEREIAFCDLQFALALALHRRRNSRARGPDGI